MQLKDDVVPNVECLTDQHFQLYQTWRIIHLLLVYTRGKSIYRYIDMYRYSAAWRYTIQVRAGISIQSRV